jgi:hypothetical protein
LLAFRELLALTAADIAVCVVMFVIGEMVLSLLTVCATARTKPGTDRAIDGVV